MSVSSETARLTREERRFFEEHGYLVIEDALTAGEIEELKAAIGRCAGDVGAAERNEADILGRDRAFLDLVDHRSILLRMASLLGWNLWVNHSHFNITPPTRDVSGFAYRWHRDGGISRWDLKGVTVPPMAMKVGFYLTDVSHAGAGQTYIFPGSHRLAGADAGLPTATPPPPSAVPINVKAGAAVLYHPGVIHSLRTPNATDTVRLAVFVQWAFRWLQPVDAQTVGHLDGEVLEPMRRQMLGLSADLASGRTAYYTARSGRYYPTAAEVPLRGYLEQLGEPVDGWVR